MPMIAITIMSSISVKPFCCFIMNSSRIGWQIDDLRISQFLYEKRGLLAAVSGT
jgi:hypothetical protein